MTTAHDVVESVSRIIGPVYLVGGSVRDALMGRSCGDFDFATPHDPDTVEAAVRDAGRRPYLVGKRFGTVAFKLDGSTIEVTTFRSQSYRAGSRSPNVKFLPDLEHDLAQRDFTINAMALHGDELIDLFGGRRDLDAQLVRAVGDPAERLLEDPLRMLRAARFVSQLDFGLDERLLEAIAHHAALILSVARERWMTELDQLLMGPGVGLALRLLADSGLMRYMLPEIALQARMVATPGQSDAPPADPARTLFDETVEGVASAPQDITLRWAALLRNVAAPYDETALRDETTPPHDGAARNDTAPRGGASPASQHVTDADAPNDRALLGAEIVERTALYLKWSTSRREDVKRLVAEGRSART